MSSIIRDVCEEWKATGVYLTNEMYEGGRSRNPRKELTTEQLWNLLEIIRVESFDNYQKAADEMGW